MKFKKIASIFIKKFELPNTTIIEKHYIISPYSDTLLNTFCYCYNFNTLESQFVFIKFSPKVRISSFLNTNYIQRFFFSLNKLALINIKLILFLFFTQKLFLTEREFCIFIDKIFDFKEELFKLKLNLGIEEKANFYSLYLNFYYLTLYLLILTIFRKYEA